MKLRTGARWLVGFFAAALGLAGCKGTEPARGEAAPPLASAAPSASVAPPSASSISPPLASAAPASPAVDPTAWLTAAPIGGKAVGNTSVAFKVKLEGGLEALYKPRSKRHNERYRGEVAGYRLGVALGLPNVPPAYLRLFDAAALGKALGGDSPAAKLLASEGVPTADGRIVGALMPWRPRFDLLSLEKPEWRAKWKAWLGDGAMPTGDDAKLAGQISTLLGFDLVTGNWDRWSGGNIVIDQPTQTILFIDNDAAFFEVPPGNFGKEQQALVEATQRFSRSFVEALRRLDGQALEAALGEGVPGSALLSKKAMAGVLQRRSKLLAIVAAQVARRGEDAVLVFP